MVEPLGMAMPTSFGDRIPHRTSPALAKKRIQILDPVEELVHKAHKGTPFLAEKAILRSKGPVIHDEVVQALERRLESLGRGHDVCEALDRGAGELLPDSVRRLDGQEEIASAAHGELPPNGGALSRRFSVRNRLLGFLAG
jgi:hypothetical protein